MRMRGNVFQVEKRESNNVSDMKRSLVCHIKGKCQCGKKVVRLGEWVREWLYKTSREYLLLASGTAPGMRLALLLYTIINWINWTLDLKRIYEFDLKGKRSKSKNK